jgi:hypothetical protein
MTVIDEAWEAIRSEKRNEPGWHVRRVHIGAPCEIFVGILQPGAVPGLLIEVSVGDVPVGSQLPKSRGFELVPVLLGGGDMGRVRFALKLTDPVYEPVFSVLCADAARAAESESRPRAAIRAWINRLHVWQEFMARHGVQGLSEIAALGLIGELFVMRNVAIPLWGCAAAVQAWSGPLGEPNDFAFSWGFLEVKSTTRQAPDLIEISGIDQLDDARGRIILAHARLRLSTLGESLPQVISTLRTILAHDSAEYVRRFNELLMSAGYIDDHYNLYDRSYELISVEFFQVAGDFPRIRRSDICDGIRDLRYSIELMACSGHMISEYELSRLFRGRQG